MRTSPRNSWNWSLLAGLVLVGCGGPAAAPSDPAPAPAPAVATAAPEVEPAPTPDPAEPASEDAEEGTPQQEATPAPKPGI